MRILYSCLVFVLLNLSLSNLKAQTPLTATCRVQDSLQLVSLYDATNGGAWINKTNWKTALPIDTWYGVTLTADGCNVAQIILDDNNLIGKLPKLSLQNLVHLSLRRNLLTDTIPNFVAPKLQYLNLSLNQLSGNIPNFTFVSPDSFYIDNNQFVFGNIANKKWLSAKVLVYAPQSKISIGVRNDSLYVTTGVSDNEQQFNWFKDGVYLGTFTSSVFKPTVSGMYYCLITHNTLTIQNNIDKNLVLQSQNYSIRVSAGKRVLPLDLPVCLEDDFYQLETLYDSTGGKNWINSANWFTSGNMNSWFGITTNSCDIKTITLPNNNLVGHIPNFDLPGLTVLNLSNNKLSGVLPNVSSLSVLDDVDLSKNQLSGSLGNLNGKSTLITLGLSKLDLSDNQFSGDVPDFFSTSSVTFNIAKNRFVFADIIGKQWLNALSVTYAPQSKISIGTKGDSLVVSTGSPENEQSFSWYRNGSFLTTTTVSKYLPTAPGTYYCAVSHNTLTKVSDPKDSQRNLVLYSDSFVVKSSKNGRAFPITLKPCLESCFNQLESLYDATAGNNWTNKSNWFATADLNKWYGIVLTSDGCDIDSISLKTNKLTGTLPNLNLPQLRALNLSDNNLSGVVPALDTLPKLVDLNLSINKLTGNIPAFTNNQQLITINFSNNQLAGSIPAFTANQQLITVNFSSNKLNGNVPDFVLPKLKSLILTSNALTGSIPNFAGAANLVTLQLDSNKLSGSVPDFANNQQLTTINFSSNQLSVNIPAFTNNQQLTTINFSNNAFIFGDLAGKRWLSLANLSYAPQAIIPINLSADGTLSVNTGAPDADQTFNWYLDGVKVLTSNSSTYKPTKTGKFSCQITHNPLTVANNIFRNLVLQSKDTALRISNGGRFFPKGLRQCLEDDYNQLEALYDATDGKNWINKKNWLVDSSLTNWFGVTLTPDSCDVSTIDLGFNNLVGTIPNLNLPQLDTLFLNSNKLSGTIPDFKYLQNATDIELDVNKLTGTIPNFDLQGLKTLILSRNKLTGTIPDLSLNSLEDFEAEDNALSGNFPNLFLPSIVTLYLNNNQISGAIPGFYSPTLAYVDLSDNKLSGSFPSFDFPELKTLYLSNNQLAGNIPDFSQSPKLRKLVLFTNKLNGSIPNFNLPKLTYLDLFDNQLTGNIPNFNLPVLTDLYLNNNQLSGSIPNFNGLPNLVNLSVRVNKLTGAVPDFNLPKLEILSLRNNQLSGDVPNLVNLTKLDLLYLNDNKFIFGDIVGKRWLKPLPTNLTYAPQAKIPITLGADGMLSVSTGTPDADQKFKWYFIALNTTTPTLVATTSSSKFKPTATGQYYVQATHNTLTNTADSTQNLVLQSDNYNVGVSNGGRILPIGLPSCLVDDFNQLEALYDSTGGANWTKKANWLTGADLKTWDNVKLTTDGCDVAELNLSSNNLAGRLPNINLPQLINLDLGFNHLNGKIPTFSSPQNGGTVGGLPSLRVLLLDDNEFSDKIPILNLPALTALDISHNLLTGNIPDMVLPQLKSLFANNNLLSGNISNLTPSTVIEIFNVSDNKFVFGDMEGKQWLNATGASYSPQAIIPIVLGADGYLSVSTGAADADQVFKWYNNGGVTITNSRRFKPTASGTWSCQISHNTITKSAVVATNLVLQSASITLRVSPGGRIIPNGLPVCLEPSFNQLEALYDSTGGINWTNKANWFTADMSKWFGVALTPDGCDVTTIKLNSNNLVGNLPNINLVSLVELDLSNNKLAGTIPAFKDVLNASMLPSLKNLNLNTNQFSGAIPNLGLPNIVSLDLSANKLTGSIPAFSASQFSKLLNLYLNSNQLSGAIPNFNLPTLTSLQLGNNLLTGTIPNFVFPNLTNLQLNNNQLTGTIPNFVFPNLTLLFLQQNQLSGTIPNFNMPKLSLLFLSNNKLSGAIPTFSNLTSLTSLNLDNNAFIFGDMLGKPWLNPQSAYFASLRYAYQAKIPLAFNNGVFSVTTGGVDADQTFNWYKNGVLVCRDVACNVSTYKPTGSGIYSCQITHKTLTIPSDFFKNFVLQTVDSFVRISNGGRIIPNTLPLCLENTYNQLEAVYDSTGGANWTNKANWLTSGDMSTWSGVSLSSDGCDLSILSLGSNNLVGTLPNIASKSMVVLDVSGNKLTGNIPNFSIANLVVLNAGNNKFTGAIPNFNSPALKGILLSNNQFSGAIPNFSIPALKILDVSFNKLTGSIPKFTLFFLSDLIFQSNQLTGSIPDFNLRFLKTIDVRDNLLSGNIPPLASAPSLSVMYLQNNAFIFGDMVGKRWLDTNNVRTLAYAPQAFIPLTLNADGTLQVSTGALDADQIFKWYVDGVLVATTQSSIYKPTATGVFTCQITHNAVTVANDNSRNLILKTSGVTIRVSKGGRIFPVGLAACLEDDFNQLEAIYDSTGGANWAKKTNWFTNPDLKTWYGVSLTVDGCDVAKINLSTNNLVGRLPNINLPQLTMLDASSNKLSGSIPNLSQTNLSRLLLNDNVFTGSIPNFVLVNLTFLDLSTNQLSGSIPNLATSLQLTAINFQNNQLSGNVPAFTLNTQLSTLNISNNNFVFGDIEGKTWLTVTTLTYAPQASIPIALNTDGTISVSTGSADANQIFKWFADGVLIATTQSSKYTPTVSGNYSCQIFHNTLTVGTTTGKNLVLQSLSIALRISTGGRIFPTGLAACLEDDFNQLEALYDSTSGANWTAKTGWFTQADMSKWYGVTLDKGGCDVAAIQLVNNNLAGSIPNFKLPNLVYLDLDTNKLTGNIPNFNLPNLVDLYLENNALTGSIPNFNLPNLDILDVSFNKLTGNIPSLDACKLLTAIGFNNNQLSGNIPAFTVNSQLSTVNFSNNSFIFGDIVGKPWLCRDVACNVSTSYAPQAKIAIVLGTDGILSVNTGAPDGDQIYKWFKNGVEIPNTNSSKLKPTGAGIYYCQATHNTLTVPATAAKNLVLQSIDANINFSPGGRVMPLALPSCLVDDFNQLEVLYDSTAGKNWTNKAEWFTNADMTKWFGVSLTTDGCDVMNINLSNNKLAGILPVVKLPNLKVIDVSKNALTGRIPDFTAISNQLTTISLNNNQFSGSLPNINLPALISIDASTNVLTGKLPAFTNNQQLTTINFSNNQFSGSIPDFAANTKLKTINFSNNQFSGTIPNFNLPSLTNLELDNNQFTGDVPNFNLPLLVDLELNDNKLTNGIPSFNLLQNLQTLILGANQFTNGIPSFNLPKLQILYLDSNKLSGNIPNFNLPLLQTLDVSANQLTGAVPKLNLSPNLKVLNIADNGFIFGDIAGKPWVALGNGVTYSPQAKISINYANDSLVVATGEPDSAQQFKWYKNGNLEATTTTSKYKPQANGIYNCKVSHNALTIATDNNRNLILQSENFEVSIFAVNFFSFTGKKGDVFNLLDWKTSLEVISDSFVVERSKDSINFAPVGAIKGAGNSTSMLAYQFKDNAPLVGNNYYRIKAKDNSGKFVYSIIIVISFNTPTLDIQSNDFLTVYPNPAQEFIVVSCSLFVGGQQLSTNTYQLTTITGQILQTGKLKDGDRLNISDFATGVYFLRTSNKVVKFIKE